MPQQQKDNLLWFAAKVSSSRKLVDGIVAHDCVETYTAGVVPNILFLHCSSQYPAELSARCPGALFFYRDPERKSAQSIDERQMRNFMLVNSAPQECLIALDGISPEFLQGQKVRVTGGIFEGAEGVVRRIKGDRRLLVDISGIAVVATSYIHPSLLEPIDH